MIKITQKILVLKQDASIDKTSFKFPSGTEFEIVADIVYMSGFPIPPDMQGCIYDWLVVNMDNKVMFKEDFRRFN